MKVVRHHPLSRSSSTGLPILYVPIALPKEYGEYAGRSDLGLAKLSPCDNELRRHYLYDGFYHIVT